MVFARGLTMPSLKTFGTIPVSWFYKSRKATGLGKAFSRFWSAWASFGLPPRRQVALEVKGRRTGRPHTVALVIAGYEGEHYLVSMLGECEWVKNVRASGEAHIIGGRRRKVKLEEVPIERRARTRLSGNHRSRLGEKVRFDRDGLTRASRCLCGCPGQRDGQSAHPLEDPRARVSLRPAGFVETNIQPALKCAARAGRHGLRQGPHNGITKDAWDDSHLLFLQERESHGPG